MNKELLDLAMKAGFVRRYHTLPTAGEPEQVGSHTYGVMVVLDAILGAWATHEMRSKLLRAALYHDAAEYEVGDMPYTTKMTYPELREIMHKAERTVFETVNYKGHYLDEDEKVILKIADLSQMSLYAAHQLNMGNRYYFRVLENANTAVDGYVTQLKKYNTFPDGRLDGIYHNCYNLREQLFELEEQYK